MKLWFVFMFKKEKLRTHHELVFLVRASDPVACAKFIESHKADLPDHIDPFITGIVEMGEDPYSDTPAMLAGPFSGLINYEPNEQNTYWRRGEQNEPWVNFDQLDQGDPISDCILENDVEASLFNISSEDDVLKVAHSILAGQFDNDLNTLGDQLDLCIEYLKSNNLLNQYQKQKSHPLIRAIHYLTKKLIEKTDEINTDVENAF